MKKRPHFKAVLTYLPTEDSGIVTPVSSGFRSLIRFPYETKDVLINQTFLETELVFPGDTVSADITLVDSNEKLEKLYNGLEFDIFINSDNIATGVISHLYTLENEEK